MSDYLREAFRESGRRWTSQRRLVLEVLEASSEHLDAETIYHRAKTHEPEISLATVYRTLTVLKDMGLVEEHRFGEEHCHYEPVQEGPHYHFTCVNCGGIIEFDTPLMDEIERELVEREGVYVTNIHLHISGHCARCQRKIGATQEDEYNES